MECAKSSLHCFERDFSYQSFIFYADLIYLFYSSTSVGQQQYPVEQKSMGEQGLISFSQVRDLFFKLYFLSNLELANP